MSPPRNHTRSAISASVAFLVLLSAFYLLVSITGRSPVIEDIRPGAASPGEEIVITGDHFGQARGRSKVRIAGSAPTSSAYREWSDDRIVLEVPEDATSGLAYVETDRGRSNGVLFANARRIPHRPSNGDSSARPVISSIEPQTVTVGELLTIHGNRFGNNRNGGTVRFSWVSEEGRRSTIEVDETEFGYVDWSARRVQVRVPDGAVSGRITVETARGTSDGVELTVEHPVGRKRFSSRLSHAVALEVSLDSVQYAEEAEGGTVYLWVPQIAKSTAQHDVQTLTESRTPLFSPAAGVSLYRVRDPAPESVWRLRRSVIFDRYAVDARVEREAVSTEYGRSAEFLRRFTSATQMLPVTTEPIQAAAATLERTALNPYVRAVRTYEYVISNLAPRDQVGAVDAVAALEEGSANAFGYAALTVSLLRAQGIPARPVSGYLVWGDRDINRHYWAEFYVEGFGWVPLDPAAADSAVDEAFPLPEEPADFYFGRLDANRVAFSHGLIEVPRMHPEGRTRHVETMYSLQTHHQEVAGDIRWYRVLWHDIDYLGEY